VEVIMVRRGLWAAIGGALGGLVNAALCYLEWPVPVPDAPFKWHVMPAGLLHGAALAALGVAAADIGGRLKPGPRWALALPAAWVIGYVTWIPLAVSVFGEPLSRALVWPIDGETWVASLLLPLAYFGAVALLVYLWQACVRPIPHLWANVVAACAAGVIGSLWFWISYQRWAFSILHGVIWGCLVSASLVWAARREVPRS
jgi:hypothetical protein